MNLTRLNQLGRNAMHGLLFLVALCANATEAQVQATAELVANGLGKVTDIVPGTSGSVYIFEENHASKVGQIEIAHMLVRLYKKHHLRTVGLEGLTAGKLVPKWATKMVAADRLRVAARLLADGEIGSGEFLAVAFPEVSVIAIDDAKDYQYGLSFSGDAGEAPVQVMVLMAQQSLSPPGKEKFNDLLVQGKQDEAFAFLINSDSWAKAYGKGIGDPTRLSGKAEAERVTSLQSEAKRRGFSVPKDLSAKLDQLREFYSASARRDDAMAARLAQIAKADSPIAGTVGAAHTRGIVQALRTKGFAVAVIRPNALVNDQTTEGDIRAYERKRQRLSVDEGGLVH